MNDITSRAIRLVADENKSAAERLIQGRHEGYFIFQVQARHWMLLVAEHGVSLKERALRLFRAFRPDCFDDEGFLKTGGADDIDLDFEISMIVNRFLEKMLEGDSELQLSPAEEYRDFLVGVTTRQLDLL